MLEECSIKTPKFNIAIKNVRAKCVKIYDGDTGHFVFSPFSNGELYRFCCRLARYNTAEMKSKDLDEKNKALAAKSYLSNLLLNKLVNINTYGFDKYGRVLIDVFLDDIHVNQHMIDQGYGAEYNGCGAKLYGPSTK